MSARVSLVAATALATHLAVYAAPRAPLDARPAATAEGDVARVETAIVQAIRERMGPDAEVTLSEVTLTGQLTEPLIVAIPAPGARTGGPIRFQILGAGGGRRVHALGWATASVQVAVEHVRVRQLVSKGRIVSADEVESSRDVVGGLPLRWLPRLREVQGARVLTNLAPGSVLSKSSIASSPAVKSGQLVRATARVGAVEVVAELVAMQDGDPGATVRVVNRGSRRELRARVIEPGLVEVLDE